MTKQHRRIGAAALAAVALGAVAAQEADAHTLRITAACDVVTWSYTAVAPTGTQTAQETVTVDGVARPTTSRSWVSTSSAATFTTPLTGLTEGAHTISARSVFVGSDGFRATLTSGPVTVRCAAPPVPPVTPTPPLVPVAPLPPAPPPPPPAPTCAELVAKYPKAGPKRRAAWGCPAPPVRNEPPLKVRKREVTLRAVGCIPNSGVRAYTVRRIEVTWTRAGEVVARRFSRTYRVPGILCKLPPVTG